MRRNHRALARFLAMLSALLAVCALPLVVGVYAQRGMDGMGMGGMGGMHGMGGMGGMMGPPPSAGENPLPASPEVLAKGKTLFEANCAACHGPLGRGDGPAGAGLTPRPPDLRGNASTWSDGQIAAQIQNGRGGMPAFAKPLDNRSIWSIVHHVRRLQR
jgi:mono/diheme cytochrome c family protein